jgi:hypothetical protein
MPYFSCHYLYISFIYCTYWVPTISVLNLSIFPCYSNLLLRRWRWTGILRRVVLGYVLPQLPFLWCYRVFRYSISLWVILVFKDIIYIINILYTRDIWLSVSTFGRMCGTIDPGSCIWWVLGFGIKTGYDNQVHVEPKSEIPSEQVHEVLVFYKRQIAWVLTLLWVRQTSMHPTNISWLLCFLQYLHYSWIVHYVYKNCMTP